MLHHLLTQDLLQYYESPLQWPLVVAAPARLLEMQPFLLPLALVEPCHQPSPATTHFLPPELLSVVAQFLAAHIPILQPTVLLWFLLIVLLLLATFLLQLLTQ